MSRKLLLRASAFFTLITFAAHTFGALAGPPPDQMEMMKVYDIMKQTMVTFPFGSPKSIATLMFGANLGMSLLLLLSGLIFLLLSEKKDSALRFDHQLLALNSLALVAMAVISLICFFPMPAICCGLAGLLGLVGASRR